MRNAKYKFVGLLLIFTLFGFIVLAPVSATTQSWVGADKYAKYRGGIDIKLGINATVSLLMDFNWKMAANHLIGEVNVTGGWIIHASVNLMGTSASFSFSSAGWEIVDTSDSTIKPPPGGDIFFGIEHLGAHTNLWLDSDQMTGLTESNVSIGGRGCYAISASAGIMGYPVPLTKYYDIQTGVLMGFGISVDLTALTSHSTPPTYKQVPSLSEWSGGGGVRVNQLPGMGGLGLLTFPVVVNSTNVVPFAWNVGGDPVLLLEAVGVLLGLSALFGVMIYAKKK